MTLGRKLVVAIIAAIAFAILLCIAAWLPGAFNNHAMVAAANDAVVEHPELLPIAPDVQTPKYTYIEVTDSCGPHFDGECVNIRKGPGEEYPSVAKLRAGAVLETSEAVATSSRTWYKIVFNEWLRYPERAGQELFVAGDYVRPFEDIGPQMLGDGETGSSTKRIVVDRSEQKLYAYDGDTLFMEQAVSTGLELTPSPRGTFSVYRKTPTRYMQGPIPEISDQYYDLPGVPWNLYFSLQGAVIHGAYWHNSFGQPWSHGCVNLPPDKAHELYEWADLGTKVIVRD